MIPGLQPYIDITISEGDKIVKKYRRRKCRSFVKQFAQMLLHSMSLNTVASVTDTGNTSRTLVPPVYSRQYQFHLSALSGDVTSGSVVGSGTNAEAITDYALQTLITHGTTSGKLQYSAVTFGAPTTDATTSYMTVTRIFTNGSSGNVSVNEIGLYSYFYNNDTSVGWYFCLVRDKLDSTIVLSSGQNMTLNYVLKIVI